MTARVASILSRIPSLEQPEKPNGRWVHNGPIPADVSGRSLELENASLINAIHGTPGRREFVKLPELRNR